MLAGTLQWSGPSTTTGVEGAYRSRHSGVRCRFMCTNPAGTQLTKLQLRCLFIVLPPSGCTATDVDCICASDSLEHDIAACLLANCTMQDSLGMTTLQIREMTKADGRTQDTSRVQRDLCNLSDESKTREVILYTSIVYSIAFLSVTLRVAGKAVSKRLAWDDAMVVAALLLTAIPLGCVLDMTLKGFGEHLWNLEDGKLLPILRYCKCIPYGILDGMLIRSSVHLVVDICYRPVYDQDLTGLVLS